MIKAYIKHLLNVPGFRYEPCIADPEGVRAGILSPWKFYSLCKENRKQAREARKLAKETSEYTNQQMMLDEMWEGLVVPVAEPKPRLPEATKYFSERGLLDDRGNLNIDKMMELRNAQQTAEGITL